MNRQFSTFRVADHLMGIDVLRVQEVIREQPITRVPLAAREVHGLMNLRGQIVTAIDLRRRFGLPDRPAGAPALNVVVRTHDGAVGLVVDAVGDVMELTEQQFEPPPSTRTGSTLDLVLGTYKLPDQLLLAVDLDRLIDARSFESNSTVG